MGRKSRGYKAAGVNENEYDRKTLVGKVSFRQLAVLAGLGSVGDSQMLLTLKCGPRVVIGTVFTEAEVEPDRPFLESLCNRCGVCKDGCPTGAIRVTLDRLSVKTGARF